MYINILWLNAQIMHIYTCVTYIFSSVFLFLLLTASTNIIAMANKKVHPRKTIRTIINAIIKDKFIVDVVVSRALVGTSLLDTICDDKEIETVLVLGVISLVVLVLVTTVVDGKIGGSVVSIVVVSMLVCASDVVYEFEEL